MISRLSIAFGAAVAAAALAQAANAGVAFYSYGVGQPNLPVISKFDAYTVDQVPSAADGWFGNAVILNTSSADGAEPAVSPGVPGTDNYLSVEGGHSETLTFGAGSKYRDISLYVGSLDNYNHLVFTLADHSTVSFDGNALAVLSGADNGNQTAANTNGVFNFTFGQAVDSIKFSSDSNSFEIASIAAGVPEPATWAMMILGVAFAGASLRQRKAVLATA